jgi:hypothetical protein
LFRPLGRFQVSLATYRRQVGSAEDHFPVRSFLRCLERTLVRLCTLSDWEFERMPRHIGPEDPAQQSQCRIRPVDEPLS